MLVMTNVTGALFNNSVTDDLIIIIIKLIYRGQPYQCLGTVLPKGPLWCNADSIFHMRMNSLIRTQLSDTRREVGTFSEETFGYSCTSG